MTRAALVFGAGGFAAEIIDIAQRVGGIEIAGCVVDRDPAGEAPAPDGVTVFRWRDVADRGADYVGINGIGSPARPMTDKKDPR